MTLRLVVLGSWMSKTLAIVDSSSTEASFGWTGIGSRPWSLYQRSTWVGVGESACKRQPLPRSQEGRRLCSQTGHLVGFCRPFVKGETDLVAELGPVFAAKGASHVRP